MTYNLFKKGKEEELEVIRIIHHKGDQEFEFGGEKGRKIKDVDVIQNFPIPSSTPQEESGYGINVNPYYSLAYYSKGKNLLAGLIKKIRANDKEILEKLRTL